MFVHVNTEAKEQENSLQNCKHFLQLDQQLCSLETFCHCSRCCSAELNLETQILCLKNNHKSRWTCIFYVFVDISGQFLSPRRENLGYELH